MTKAERRALMFFFRTIFKNKDWFRVHRDQLASLSRATPAAMIGYGVNVALATVAFWSVLPQTFLIAWTGASFALCGFTGLRAARRRSREKSRLLSPMRNAWPAWTFGCLLALPWAVLPTVWIGQLPSNSEVVLIALSVGMAASGSILLAPIPVAAVIYVVTILMPLIVKTFVVLPSSHLILGALGLSYLAFLISLIITKARLFQERLDAVTELKDVISALCQSREENERAAMTDGLTGLANRRAFAARLSELDASAPPKTPYTIFYCDLDRFKPVNDTLGHAVGDRVLSAAATRILSLVRPNDLVARLGGDEFAIIAFGPMDKPAATMLAERLRHALAWPFAIDGQRIEIGLSIGVAMSAERISADELLKRADIAMYAAKKAGRGSFCIFEDDMQRSAEERLFIEAGLRSAIANDEFELLYQPIRQLATGALSGFECLLRWRHPKRGTLLPAQFLHVAGDMGIVGEIADWVLEKACRQAASWPSDISISVNLCSLQIKSSDIAAKVERALHSSMLDASQLELEITETKLLESEEDAVASLKRLRDQGVSIALGDFGTGFSSLSYLVSFPINRIRIDRLFVSQLGRCRESDLIVRSIAQLAKNLECRVVAQGIETGDQYRRLRALHVSHGQGHLLGQPLNAADASLVVESESRKKIVLAQTG